MNYNQSLEFINSERFKGHNGGLKVKLLLDLLGNPEDSLEFIHVTGTNGKGSTSNLISQILIENGNKVGLFTSPHIFDIRDRIKINNTNISQDDFAKYISQISEVCNSLENYNPTYFELLFVAALLYFKEEKIQFVVLEVGIGGENDPTNIVKNTIAAVITAIGIDHVDRLGGTEESAAKIKSKIIKKGSVVVQYNNKESVQNIIEEYAKFMNAPCYKLSAVSVINCDLDGTSFIYKNNEYKTKLIGEYQAYNASMAIEVINRAFPDIDIQTIRKGLNNSTWPARMTVLSKQPLVIVDGAHNENGIESLNSSLKYLKYNNLILCMGYMKDKLFSKEYDKLINNSNYIIYTSIDYGRAKIFKDKKTDDTVFVISDLKEAINKAISLYKEDDLILCTGSLYLVSEIMKIFNN